MITRRSEHKAFNASCRFRCMRKYMCQW